jgi:hypothetical protein
MLTFVFLVFLAFFLISGFFLSLEAKRRKDGSNMRAMHSSLRDKRAMGRAASQND